MTFRVSPGVYKRIIDDSLQASYTNPNIGAIVGAARRGPVGRKHVVSLKNRLSLYGPADPTYGYMLDSADAALMEMSELWMNRVVASDSKYSLGLISNNVIGGQASGTSFTSIPGGSTVPFSEVNRDVVDVEFSSAFLSGHTVKLTINGSDTSVVTYATSHNATMSALRQVAQTRLDAIAAGGLAWVVPVGTNRFVLRLISPQAITLAVTATLTGASPPSADIRDADWLAFIVGENQGIWGNGVAAGITNIDSGVPQRLTFTFDASIVTGNTISISINGTPFSTPFATDSNTTLSNLAAAFVAAFPGSSASVVNANAGQNGNRKVIFAAPNSSTLLLVDSVAITGGATQAGVSYAETLRSIASTGSFNFVIFENSNFVNPDEIFYATYDDGIDGLGNPTGIAYIVNDGPKKSPRVRLTVNAFFSGTVYGPTDVTNSNVERYLQGGADGSLPSTQQVVTGWDDFSNAEKITIRVLINGGYTTPEVHQKMESIARHRMDCFAILDTPSDRQTAEEATDYRMNFMDIDSFWAALYSPDILIYDAKMGKRRWIPPSGLVAAQYAYTDKTAAEWFAPAGLTRGLIQGALDLRVIYEEGDRDLLSAYQVNAIRRYGSAFPIWGEYTTQRVMSALQSVPVVRLMIMVMTEMADVVAYSLFEPNNEFTWHRIRVRGSAILDPIKNAGGVTDFYVQCDASVNTPDVIDQRVCYVNLWIKPTLAILYIMLTGIVTRQSANFNLGFSSTVQL